MIFHVQTTFVLKMYGDSPLPDNSTRATNRYSMPCFSPSFNALSLDLIQGKNVQSDVRNSSSTSDFRRDQTPVHAVHRPRSMFVSDVSSDPVIRRPRPMSSGTMDVIVEHTPHKVSKQMDFKNDTGWQPSHELPSYADLSIEDIIVKIQTMIDTLGEKHECLCVLKREITAIKQLFQVFISLKNVF